MAKDPAILWYWNDWNGGTSTFSRHLKGCYIDLLSAQFNSGPLSLLEIKTVLGSDFGLAWPALQKKFKQDGNEMFYNERMEDEKKKRRAFTESRRKNAASPKHMLKQVHNHTVEHMENENVNDNSDELGKGGLEENRVTLEPGGFFSDQIDKSIVLTDIQIGATVEYIRIKTKKVIDSREVVEQWEAFKIIQLSVHEWYSSFEKLLNHFRDSLKIELFRTNGKKSAATTGRSIEFDRP